MSLRKDIPTISHLYDLYQEDVHKRIYFFISGYPNSGQDSEDLAQETWFRATRAYTTVPDDWDVHAWVMRIAVNVCIDYLRRRKRRLEETNIISEYNEEWCEVAEPGPEDSFINRERIEATFAKMTPRDRIILDMHADGYSYKEIQQVTRKRESGVKMIISRSKQKFRRLYNTTE